MASSNREFTNINNPTPPPGNYKYPTPRQAIGNTSNKYQTTPQEQLHSNQQNPTRQPSNYNVDPQLPPHTKNPQHQSTDQYRNDRRNVNTDHRNSESKNIENRKTENSYPDNGYNNSRNPHQAVNHPSVNPPSQARPGNTAHISTAPRSRDLPPTYAIDSKQNPQQNSEKYTNVHTVPSNQNNTHGSSSNISNYRSTIQNSKPPHDHRYSKLPNTSHDKKISDNQNSSITQSIPDPFLNRGKTASVQPNTNYDVQNNNKRAGPAEGNSQNHFQKSETGFQNVKSDSQNGYNKPPDSATGVGFHDRELKYSNTYQNTTQSSTPGRGNGNRNKYINDNSSHGKAASTYRQEHKDMDINKNSRNDNSETTQNAKYVGQYKNAQSNNVYENKAFESDSNQRKYDSQYKNVHPENYTKPSNEFGESTTLPSSHPMPPQRSKHQLSSSKQGVPQTQEVPTQASAGGSYIKSAPHVDKPHMSQSAHHQLQNRSHATEGVTKQLNSSEHEDRYSNQRYHNGNTASTGQHSNSVAKATDPNNTNHNQPKSWKNSLSNVNAQPDIHRNKDIDPKINVNPDDNKNRQKYEKRPSTKTQYQQQHQTNAPLAKRRDRIQSHQETSYNGTTSNTPNSSNTLQPFDSTPRNKAVSMTALNVIGQSNTALNVVGKTNNSSGVPQQNKPSLYRSTSVPTLSQQLSNKENGPQYPVNMAPNGNLHRHASVLSLAMHQTGQSNLRRAASLHSLVASNPNLTRTISTMALYEMQVEKGVIPRDHYQALVLAIIATFILPPISCIPGGILWFLTVQNKSMWKIDLMRAISTNTRVFWGSLGTILIGIIAWVLAIVMIALHTS